MLNPLWRKTIAELLGTFGLVAAGGGAIIANSQNALSGIGVALAFGLVIALMVAATGHISGGHINPAVSIGLSCTGHLPWKELPYYVVAQLVGATLAALMLLGFFGAHAMLGTVNAPALHVSAVQAGLVEVVITAFLVFVISAVATDENGIGRYVAPFAIGGTILLGALWGGPISSGSMNPARSFGPALISGLANSGIDWANLTIYIVGPIIGGIIGAFLYHIIRQPGTEVQGEEMTLSSSNELPATPRPKVTPVVNKQKARTRR